MLGITFLVCWFCSPWVAAQENVAWQVRHQESPPPGLSWQRLIPAYLGSDWQEFDPSKSDSQPSNRMLIGLQSWPPMKEALASLQFLPFASYLPLKPQQGLVVIAPDPDGDGNLVLFLGNDAQGLRAGFTVPINLQQPSWLLATEQKVVAQGLWLSSPPRKTDVPLLLRLDQELFALHQQYASFGRQEEANQIARRFAGFQDFFDAAIQPGVDLRNFHIELLAAPKQMEISKQLVATLDLDAIALDLWSKCKNLLGPPPGLAPEMVFFLGPPNGTNARSFGLDPSNGRPRILINLNAHSSATQLRVSMAHEMVHTWQPNLNRSFPDRVIHEGMAVACSGFFVPEAKEFELMMWPEEKLQQAKHLRAPLLQAFCQAIHAASPNPKAWLLLGHAPADIPQAPDRVGYWFGKQAVELWLRQHPQQGMADLLHTRSETILSALCKASD